MANPFVHVELDTTNLKKAKAFYAKLFDWKPTDFPMPTPGGPTRQSRSDTAPVEE